MYRHASLKYRIAAVVFLFGLLLLALVLWQVLPHSYQSARKRIEKHEQALFSILEQRAAYALHYKEYGHLYHLIGILDDTELIERVVVVDHRGWVVASDDVALLDRPLPDLSDLPQAHWRTAPLNDASGSTGMVAAAFSSAGLKQAHAEAIRLGLLIGGIGVVAAAAFSLAAGFGLTRRLNRLNDYAQKLARGEPSPLIDQHGTDEVVRLGQSIQFLHQSLRDHMDRLSDSERRLAERERLFRELAEHIHEVFWVIENGRPVYFSPAFESIYGLPKERVLNDPGSFRDILHPDDRDRWVETFTHTLARQKGSVEAEFRFYRPDGEPRWIQVKSFPVEWNDRTQRVVGVSEDITTRKRAAQALRESEEKYRTLVENAAEGVLIMQDGRVVFHNRRSAEMAGYSQDDYARIDPFDLVHPEDLETIWANQKNRAAGGSPPSVYEFRIFHKSGQVRWLRIHAAMITWEGRPANMGLISDVTDQKITQETMAVHQIELEERVRRRTQELMRANQVLELEIEQRKEAESELKKSEAQYRAMAANFPNGAVILFDRELRYRIADGLGLEEVGLSQSVLEGRTIFEVFPPEVYEQIEPRYRAVLAGRIQAFEMEYGGRFYQVRCVPVRDENGRVAWGLVMTQDISREREAAEKLEAAFREVEQKNRELELFAYAASHDLKSPLRAISSLSQWLEEDLGPVMKKPQRDQMELLRRRVKRMEALIDGLLAYSRVGRFPESPVELNVGEVLQRVIGTVNPPPGFEVRTPPEPPVLVADELRLAQVFQNLIDNAVKYHPGPQGTITIESDRVDGHWRFCVRDDGPGIAPRFQERVFQMFQTLQSRDEVESTGIGLPLIKKIVESKGGRVWVESEGRNGAAFFFTWPDREENESNV